ncbi:MAG: Fic family protein [Candidatus Omnitrophota bacterium]
MLFGKKPQRFLITSEVKCLHFHGTEVRKPIPSYQIYKGAIFELVDQSLDFVMSKITRSVGTRLLGAQAPVKYELPREAVAEGIVNAVVHRNYASNASVQVMLFSDRLEVWNPGELPPGLTIEGLRRPHASIPHNPLICEPAFLAHYAEKAGSGILDMIKLCKAAGVPTPTFRQDGGQFVQTLWRAKKSLETIDFLNQDIPTQSPTQSTDPVKSVVFALKQGERSSGELRRALGIKHRPTFRKNYLHPALKAGLVEITLPGKPNSRLQKYRLTKKGIIYLKKQFLNYD